MALLFGNVVFEAHKDGSCTCIVGGSNYPLTRDNMQELKHWLQSVSIRLHLEPGGALGGYQGAVMQEPQPQNWPGDVGQVAQQGLNAANNAHN